MKISQNRLKTETKQRKLTLRLSSKACSWCDSTVKFIQDTSGDQACNRQALKLTLRRIRTSPGRPSWACLKGTRAICVALMKFFYVQPVDSSYNQEHNEAIPPMLLREIGIRCCPSSWWCSSDAQSHPSRRRWCGLALPSVLSGVLPTPKKKIFTRKLLAMYVAVRTDLSELLSQLILFLITVNIW